MPIKCTVTNPEGTMEVGIAVGSDTLRDLQAAEQIGNCMSNSGYTRR